MSKKFIIYDPPMCCSTGVCGPNPDQALINLQDTLEKIQVLGAIENSHAGILQQAFTMTGYCGKYGKLNALFKTG